MERIIVLGAGAVGSYYGALLSRRNDVLLVGRPPHVKAINYRALILSGGVKGTFKVRAITEVQVVPPGSMVLLTTKAHDSVRAIETIKDLLHRGNIILILQNGLGNEEAVKSVVDERAEVVRGLVTSGIDFPGPGRIVVRKVGETVLGRGEIEERVARVFNESGLETRLSENMTLEVWRKLVMNCVINPISAILRVTDNEVSADCLHDLRRRIVEECIAVGKAEGVEMDMGLLEELEKVIPSYRNFSSMCQDIIKGKRTEIDFLNGRVVELGRRHGIPTPANEAMASLIKFIEGRR